MPGVGNHAINRENVHGLDDGTLESLEKTWYLNFPHIRFRSALSEIQVTCVEGLLEEVLRSP